LKVKYFVSSSQREKSSPPEAAHLELGKMGEQLAAAYLGQQSYQIVAANFAMPVGRNMRGVLIDAEIDLVAYDGPTLCFIEVKTRASDWFAPPQANVDRRKQRQITRAARAYRRMFGLTDAPYRYDVVAIVLPAKTADPAGLQIEILRGFWTEETLRKRRWSESYFD
jgi:putative endonuclease